MLYPHLKKGLRANWPRGSIAMRLPIASPSSQRRLGSRQPLVTVTVLLSGFQLRPGHGVRPESDLRWNDAPYYSSLPQTDLWVTHSPRGVGHRGGNELAQLPV